MRCAYLGSFVAIMAVTSLLGQSTDMPRTLGETLGGKRILLTDTLRGRDAVVVMSFSREAGNGSSVRMDTALGGVAVYQAAMLERVPGLLRGVIKSAMRKGLTAADEQDHYVILAQDEKLWRSYFGVSAEKDPYVVLVDAAGRVRWRGHGAARDLEPLLKAALK